MDCLFCKIAEGTIPSKRVFENDSVLVFHDIQPAAPTHVLLIPKKHIASMNDAEGDDFALIGELHRVAQQVARDLGIADSGYRLINNCGRNGEQTVHHLHYHLLGGTRLGALVGVSNSHA
ncbi:histidine triad nucleotide-binding protein [Paenibacillus sediminis]|uniref:Histidine triad (HIT) family protein n=1 Tax=Paenibacillus sediminis TaxID=664909 RepID=A0ABS4GZA7_9BACL|nr:histidine triad nucleotide-binding protein [Paenibacillus sediminis]MBP1935392.1 histidine triad (HIT) family protein [Paenibacillus sediminis]